MYPPYHSVQDRTLPDPRSRGRSRDVYVEVLSMMIQNLTKPSAVPSSPEPVFLNVYGAQESIPRKEFRQPM